MRFNAVWLEPVGLRGMTARCGAASAVAVLNVMSLGCVMMCRAAKVWCGEAPLPVAARRPGPRGGMAGRA